MKLLNNQWFVGITCSIIASVIWSIGNEYIKIDILNKLFEYKIQFYLWELLMYIFIIAAIVLFVIKIMKNLKFLNYKNDNWSNINWIWEWKKNEKGLYEVSNLNMLCPKCNDGVFTVATMYSKNYDCVKCGFSIPINSFKKPFLSQIQDEIFNEVKKKFPKEIKFIENK
ncbi:hypothetical protein [Flavobacterium sp. J27]|uniref:hypothetical protein n=1 Tax=Flavobacterium sp. J27 TaxID=2060419 RepID=UPI001030158E|nr:hypothetical protein [Flavobacterium sp. J27]